MVVILDYVARVSSSDMRKDPLCHRGEVFLAWVQAQEGNSAPDVFFYLCYLEAFSGVS